MGRHSSPDRAHFYRSFFGWLGLWIMIAVVTAIGVWFAVAALGGPDAGKPVATETSSDPDEQQAPAPAVSGARISKNVATPSAAEPSDRGKQGKLVTEGVTVQVLKATNDPTATQRVADKLARLGYSVVAVEESSRLYSDTTVFWSAGSSRDAAMALAERFGWVAESKPANLSPSVSIHVVVGADAP